MSSFTYMKIKEVRQKYEPGDINVIRFLTPRSKSSIHSPTVIKNLKEKRLTDEEVIWEVDLEERIKFLKGDSGYTSLLAKNVVCDIDSGGWSSD